MRRGRLTTAAAAPYRLVATPRHGGNLMVADLVGEPSVLAALVRLVDRIPMPPPPPRARGRPPVYPDRLFLKALVIMVVKRLPRVGTLLAVLAEPTPEVRRLRVLLAEGG